MRGADGVLMVVVGDGTLHSLHQVVGAVLRHVKGLRHDQSRARLVHAERGAVVGNIDDRLVRAAVRLGLGGGAPIASGEPRPVVTIPQRAIAVRVTEQASQANQPPPNIGLVKKKPRNQVSHPILPLLVNESMVTSRELRNYTPNMSPVQVNSWGQHKLTHSASATCSGRDVGLGSRRWRSLHWPVRVGLKG